MKNFKKLIALCVATLMLAMAISISSCAETPTTSESGSSMSSTSESLSSESSDKDSSSSNADEEHEHSFSWKVQTPATCKEKGEEVYICSCNYIDNRREIPLTDHTYDTLNYNETKHWYECICGEKENETEHFGGTATYEAKAICEICYQEYGYFYGPIMSEAPVGSLYKLGDKMYNFSITTCDGSTFTLSEVLKEKQLVMINFWATWCGPCKSEFPAMNNAYIEYKDKVEILAISITDSIADVNNFKTLQGITFPMANDSIRLQDMFNVAAIPYSVIIDRNGMIVTTHLGAMTQKSDFTSLFDKYIDD